MSDYMSLTERLTHDAQSCRKKWSHTEPDGTQWLWFSLGDRAASYVWKPDGVWRQIGTPTVLDATIVYDPIPYADALKLAGLESR